LSNINRCLLRPPTGQSVDTSPMTAYQGFKVFSHVVLALMLVGITYASYIAVTCWTGISV
jgi:hypothetical protein